MVEWARRVHNHDRLQKLTLISAIASQSWDLFKALGSGIGKKEQKGRLHEMR
jgi:hypothetical protein